MNAFAVHGVEVSHDTVDKNGVFGCGVCGCASPSTKFGAVSLSVGEAVVFDPTPDQQIPTTFECSHPSIYGDFKPSREGLIWPNDVSLAVKFADISKFNRGWSSPDVKQMSIQSASDITGRSSPAIFPVQRNPPVYDGAMWVSGWMHPMVRYTFSGNIGSQFGALSLKLLASGLQHRPRISSGFGQAAARDGGLNSCNSSRAYRSAGCYARRNQGSDQASEAGSPDERLDPRKAHNVSRRPCHAYLGAQVCFVFVLGYLTVWLVQSGMTQLAFAASRKLRQLGAVYLCGAACGFAGLVWFIYVVEPERGCEQRNGYSSSRNV